MHVADQLKSENLRIKINAEDAVLNDIFPNPNRYDRYGFVVTEPYGGLGASLLIQAAIVHFYDFLPERRHTEPIYPEIYMLHVGGRYGDHSSFDFWPPRKEIFLDALKPAELLSALADRGITRLVLPEGADGNTEVLQDGASTWADHSALKNLLSSCFVYAPSGQLSEADVVLESDHPTFEANAEWTLDTDIILSKYRRDPESVYRPGPTVAVDIDRWVQLMEARDDEVDDAYAKSLLAQRRQIEGDRLAQPTCPIGLEELHQCFNDEQANDDQSDLQ